MTRPFPKKRIIPTLNPQVSTDKGDLVLRIDAQAIQTMVDNFLAVFGVSRDDVIDAARIINRRVKR